MYCTSHCTDASLTAASCFTAGVIITAVDSFLLLLIDRIGVRHLEALFGVLVGLMAIAFGIMFADAGVDIGQVIEGKLLLYYPSQNLRF